MPSKKGYKSANKSKAKGTKVASSTGMVNKNPSKRSGTNQKGKRVF